MSGAPDTFMERLWGRLPRRFQADYNWGRSWVNAMDEGEDLNRGFFFELDWLGFALHLQFVLQRRRVRRRDEYCGIYTGDHEARS